MTSKPSLGTIGINTIIKVYENAQSTNYVRVIVLAIDSSSLLVKALDNDDETIRIGGVVKHPSQNVLYAISNLTKPTVDMQSGECVFIDNKNPFIPSPEQLRNKTMSQNQQLGQIATQTAFKARSR